MKTVWVRHGQSEYNAQDIATGWHDPELTELGCQQALKIAEKLSKKYPKFLWEKNSGYGTKKHIENIKIFGITPHHRKSFKPILKMIK